MHPTANSSPQNVRPPPHPTPHYTDSHHRQTRPHFCCPPGPTPARPSPYPHPKPLLKEEGAPCGQLLEHRWRPALVRHIAPDHLCSDLHALHGEGRLPCSFMGSWSQESLLSTSLHKEVRHSLGRPAAAARPQPPGQAGCGWREAARALAPLPWGTGEPCPSKPPHAPGAPAPCQGAAASLGSGSSTWRKPASHLWEGVGPGAAGSGQSSLAGRAAKGRGCPRLLPGY